MWTVKSKARLCNFQPGSERYIRTCETPTHSSLGIDINGSKLRMGIGGKEDSREGGPGLKGCCSQQGPFFLWALKGRLWGSSGGKTSVIGINSTSLLFGIPYLFWGEVGTRKGAGEGVHEKCLKATFPV